MRLFSFLIRVLVTTVICSMCPGELISTRNVKRLVSLAKYEWSEWSPCSVSCGGGIQTRSRIRTSHRKTRTKSEVKVCNMKDCKEKDWLQKSCSKLNEKSDGGKTYLWRPFYSGVDDCWVRCRAIGQMFYARLASARDGTSCRPPGSLSRHRHVCIAGKCTELGCDGVVGSGKKEDKCGVCGGSETSCRLIAGLLTAPALAPGHNYLTTIPANASAIKVSQLNARSTNHLALRRQDGTFILNGKNALSPPGEYFAVSANFYYQNNANGREEIIKSQGPISEPIDLMLVYKEPNSGVKYEYRLPAVDQEIQFNTGTTSSPFLSDGVGNTSLISSSDSINIYYAHIGKTSYSHERDRLKRPVDVELSRNKLRSKRRKFAWKLSGFKECSKSCGGGVQNPIVICVRESTENVVPEKRCSSIEAPYIPPRVCNSKPCPHRWLAGKWGSCTATCGQGFQFREVTCMPEDAQSTITPSKFQNCHNLPQPLSKRACSLPPCEVSIVGQSSQWIITAWSKCSSECGKGVQTRRVSCYGGRCDPTKRPEDYRPCMTDRKCKDQWFTGPWQMCAGSCGLGIQMRNVLCISQVHRSKVVVNDDNCHASEKPASSQSCQLSPCLPTWFMTDWDECSKLCDSGIQKREVRCLNSNLQSSSACNETERPSPYHSCNVTPCKLNNDDCVDKLHNCPTVVQARLCSYNYYKQFCCHSCKKRI